MTVYLDTSLLAATVFDERSSETARAWLTRTRQPLIVSDLVRLEFAAVVSRAVRTARFDDAAAKRALTSFDELRTAALPMGHTRNDFDLAERLARDFATKLSAPDALHLATAANAGASIATYDLRLADAARAQGVEAAAVE